MSAQFFNQLKHLSGQYAALQRAYDDLAERVLALEAEKPGKVICLDIDTLEPVVQKKHEGPVHVWEAVANVDVTPKRRGRPPKVQA